MCCASDLSRSLLAMIGAAHMSRDQHLVSAARPPEHSTSFTPCAKGKNSYQEFGVHV